MSDRLMIVAGLAVFLALATFPIWYTMAVAEDASPPDLELPAGALRFTAAWPGSGGNPGHGVKIEALKKAFQKEGISLSGEARLTKGEQDKWRIVDKDNTRYLVAKDAETMKVYAGCIEDKETMVANHMSMLIDWRESVVRDADKTCVEINDDSYAKSLTKGCMKCHNDRQTFCYRCHEYANILQPPPLLGAKGTERGITCWNCHVEPKGN